MVEEKEMEEMKTNCIENKFDNEIKHIYR